MQRFITEAIDCSKRASGYEKAERTLNAKSPVTTFQWLKNHNEYFFDNQLYSAFASGQFKRIKEYRIVPWPTLLWEAFQQDKDVRKLGWNRILVSHYSLFLRFLPLHTDWKMLETVGYTPDFSFTSVFGVKLGVDENTSAVMNFCPVGFVPFSTTI